MLELELSIRDSLIGEKSVTMSNKPTDELRDEYDFSKGVRGKYAERFKAGTVLVSLDPDIAEALPNAEAVNDALRKIFQTDQTHTTS